jgi:ElaB/YqjD/DUF883 family membrane-anchored ribosome-binding protein
MRTGILTIGCTVLAVAGFGGGYLFRDTGAGEAARVAENLRTGLEAKVKTLEGEVAEARKAREDVAASAGAERERAAKELAEVRAKLKEAEEKVSKAAKAAPVAQASVAVKAEGGVAKSMAEMMKDPAFKEMAKSQQVAMLDFEYGKLFERFKLSDGEKQDLKNLLAERKSKEMDFGLAMMAGEKDEKKIAEGLKALEAYKTESDGKIRTFLNNEEDFQKYKNWEETKGERMQLNMSGAAFSNVGEPLTSEQEDRLVAAMHAARTQVKDLPDLQKPENFKPENMTPEMVERMMKSYDSQASQVAQQAADFLTPKQVEALKTMQQTQKTMQEMGLKMMSSGAFGGKK